MITLEEQFVQFKGIIIEGPARTGWPITQQD